MRQTCDPAGPFLLRFSWMRRRGADLARPSWLPSRYLNKGEARNSLARAVLFNRLGEVQDRSFENQHHRASGLNLLVAAITLWNTVYLERAVMRLQQSQTVETALLQHLSPLGWEHIGLTGDDL